MTNHTILLVDDEPDILASIKLLIERSPRGIKVITASSGAQGLEILRNTPVDLVISDFKMPGMDGIEFLVQARALCPGLPRVMFTAYADEKLARRAVTEAFVRDFLPKTLASRELVHKVEALLADIPASPVGAPASPGDAPAPVRSHRS